MLFNWSGCRRSLNICLPRTRDRRKRGIQVPQKPHKEIGPMKIGEAGIALIKEFEGLSLVSYRDFAKGIWTVGYGQTGPDIGPGMEITEQQALDMLRAHLRPDEDRVGRLVIVSLNQNQFDAIMSFVYNFGIDKFLRSTLLKKLNKNDLSGAADEFLRWNRAVVKGKMVVVDGLKRRRKAERALFLRPVR